MMSEAADACDLITLQAIGYVERPLSDPARADDIEGLRAAPVRLVVRKEYGDGLLGLAPGSDILVLTYFERASHSTLQVHPRGDLERPLRGVFATRSPGRPNPIGVTCARVMGVDGNVLTVMGLDAWDGTPVLDIKHFSEAFDTPYDQGPEEGA
ncbi:MAG: tRNA (N6-threonylcarbamoyladenosine(37)-N6)-methyltransferase TrmO [Anaerolineae bacterium]|jgi:L-fuculose-phosphate aldolase|nr:tRNA (N6-threonylcarbamoyladenosine(37)-N6)-methyltransferase TrmO [Anaerolineae bacterium]